MSRPGHCDVCGARVDHHRPSKHIDHAFTCVRDDDIRARRAARISGASVYTGYTPWRTYESVDGCVATGCLRGRHDVAWFRGHEYEPPPAAVLLERMRDRRARRILRRVTARGTWEISTVYSVWLDEADIVCDDWDVTRTYGDMSTAVLVTRERLGISKFVAPEPVTPRRWSLYSEREGVTAVIERGVMGTLVRP